MPHSPKIEKLVVKEGLSPQGDILFIGVVWGNNRVAWGTCRAVDVPAAVSSLQKHVAPLLEKQPLDHFRELVEQVDLLRETVVESRLVAAETDQTRENGQRVISRRELISGRLLEEESQWEEVPVTRPLPAGLRFGLSQALLNGAALSQQKPARQLLSEVFNLGAGAPTVPLLIDVEKTPADLIGPLIARAAGAVGYNISYDQPQQVLGEDAQKLQAHVRQVTSWLVEMVPDAQPAIYLNIAGGFTEIYENDEGKILGALYGLEQAAQPFPLVIENVMRGDVTTVGQRMKQVRSYLAFRKMKTKLAAGFALFAPPALAQLVTAMALHQVRLNPSQFGSIAQVLRFIADSQAQGVEVILHEDGQNVATATAVGLAAGVHTLSGPAHLFYNAILKSTGSGP